MTNGPIRLQLSRRKGFELLTLSLKFNGRDAVKVARPTKWGNPFTVTPNLKPGTKICAGAYVAVPTVEDAIACFEEFMQQRPELIEEARKELAGKNLACWCKPNDPCHADILLKIANSTDTGSVT